MYIDDIRLNIIRSTVSVETLTERILKFESTASRKATWLTMDENGSIYIWSDKPKFEGTEWWIMKGTCDSVLGSVPGVSPEDARALARFTIFELNDDFWQLPPTSAVAIQSVEVPVVKRPTDLEVAGVLLNTFAKHGVKVPLSVIVEIAETLSKE